MTSNVRSEEDLRDRVRPEFLTRMMEGKAIGGVKVDVADNQFAYTFD